MIGGDAGQAERPRRRYNEESADPVYPPVPVEVQGIIYIYNPPPVHNPGETAGDNGGQPAPAYARCGTPAGARGPASPRRLPGTNPCPRAAPTTPAAAVAPTNPPRQPTRRPVEVVHEIQDEIRSEGDSAVLHRAHGEIRDWAGRRLVSLLRLPVLRARGNGYKKKPEELKTATDRALAKIAKGPSLEKVVKETHVPSLCANIIDRIQEVDRSGRVSDAPRRGIGSRSRRCVSANRRMSCRSSSCGPFPGGAPLPTREQCRHTAANAGLSSRDSFPTRSNWPSIAPSSKTPRGTTQARTCRCTAAFSSNGPR